MKRSGVTPSANAGHCGCNKVWLRASGDKTDHLQWRETGMSRREREECKTNTLTRPTIVSPGSYGKNIGL
jgi:hypothetical protein